ncbi:hypothetical protein Pmani_020966 [Petrolisthes manimaculis]|uniref:Uncharacterized protein n=1 Tax=Petrolisthes manimaculis TaxID=1843537 RepID=A0AAE1PFQ9_9EUCA|nr:hypothetical protein Pmani_020966 [Petrolisthes manimaculis]
MCISDRSVWFTTGRGDADNTAGALAAVEPAVHGVTSGRRKEDKEIWWWNEEVQESISKKKLAKMKWDRQMDEESKQEYKEMWSTAKKEVAKAKDRAYEKLYEKLDSREGKKTFTDWPGRETELDGMCSMLK